MVSDESQALLRYDAAMMRTSTRLLMSLVWLFASATQSTAQTVPTGFADLPVVTGLDFPVAFEFVPDATGHVRAVVTHQFDARVRLVRDGILLADVMTVPGVESGGEKGLLGIAIDPDFPVRPFLYVHCDDASGTTIRISRYTLSGDLLGSGTGAMTADPGSRFDLIADVPDLASNHNGGTVRFGPDGMLYASFGEDADPCGAQDSTRLKGVILRLNVTRIPNGPGSAPRALVAPSDNPFAASPDSNARLVAAFGLRNPFRFQIDPVRGWLVIADVGQNAIEELDLLRLPTGSTAPGSAPLGADFGWPWFEGGNAWSTCPSGRNTGVVGPIASYSHNAQGGRAIVSAGAYHAVSGATLNWPAEYEGDLFFSDYYTGILRRIEQGAGSWSAAAAVPGQPSASNWGSGFQEVSDYRMGPDGALWYLRQSVGFQPTTGDLRRIVHDAVEPPPPPPAAGELIREFRSYPQPAVGSVTIDLDLSQSAVVTLEVFDARGRRVRTLLSNEGVAAGLRGLTWDGMDGAGEALPAGLYFAHLDAGGIQRRHPIALLR